MKLSELFGRPLPEGIPDEEYDEDYERSYGPIKYDDEDWDEAWDRLFGKRREEARVPDVKKPGYQA